MRKLPNINYYGLKGCYIAGGAILSTVTNNEIADFDVYCKNEESLVDNIFAMIDDGAFLLNVTDRAITLKTNDVNEEGLRTVYQFMTLNDTETPEKIFDNFDFTVCMGAFDCDTGEYHFHDDFLLDIASKTLRFNPNTRYPLNSLLRTGKYRQKGYGIPKTELIKIALTCAKKGMPETWEDIESEIGGTYGREVKLSREGKEFSFENAMEVLSNIQNIDFVTLMKEGITVDPETAEFLVKLSKNWDNPSAVNSDVFVIENESRIDRVAYDQNKTYFTITEQNTILTEEKSIDQILSYLGIEEIHSDEVTSKLDPDKTLYGYKTLKDNGNGTYSNHIYNLKKMNYEVGKVYQSKNPHFFLFPSIKKPTGLNKGVVWAKFSFQARHIKAIGDEIRVEHMKLEEIIENG